MSPSCCCFSSIKRLNLLDQSGAIQYAHAWRQLLIWERLSQAQFLGARCIFDCKSEGCSRDLSRGYPSCPQSPQLWSSAYLLQTRPCRSVIFSLYYRCEKRPSIVSARQDLLNSDLQISTIETFPALIDSLPHSRYLNWFFTVNSDCFLSNSYCVAVSRLILKRSSILHYRLRRAWVKGLFYQCARQL